MKMDDFFAGLIIGGAAIIALTNMFYDVAPAPLMRACEKDLPRSSSCKLIAVEDITKEINND